MHMQGRVNLSLYARQLAQGMWFLTTLVSSHNFVRLLFKSGYYSRAAFIKLRGIATDAQIEEPDPFADIDEDENELEENKVDC